MKYSEIFKEAKRLHDLGFAVHWLHARSKRPIEAGWTTGPRKEWKYLAETYQAGLNLGVRLGTPSALGGGYLTVVDVDIKSTEKRHRVEAELALKNLLGAHAETLPHVSSGRQGGSGHYYCLAAKPFKTYNPAASVEMVKVRMPSKQISKVDRAGLTEEELEKGLRMSRAWEISLYSEGRQVVLPPSVHPDTGKLYLWTRHLTRASDLALLSFGEEEREEVAASSRPKQPSKNRLPDPSFEFTPVEVEVEWLPIRDEVRDAIIYGMGVTDRSGYLLKAAQVLMSAGLDQNEVLSVLTDPDTFLGECSYDHAQTRDRWQAAKWVYKYTLKKVATERDASQIFTKVSDDPPAPALGNEARAAQDAEMGGEYNWRQGILHGGQNGNGAPQKLVQNVVLILTHAVQKDVVKRDDFAYRDSYSCDTPWGGKKDAHISDDDVATIKYWLGKHWGFEPTNNTISDALIVMARENAYDPVRDMIEKLPAWDGVPRLNTWLKDHFEAQGDPEYLAQVFRKWMVAMVMRIYQPGAKFDWMPIFEGAQGVGKSSFGRLLVGDKYFLDWLPNLNDKDSALSLQGMWGVEMGELSQFKRNELENIKAFITRTVDKLRPPYGRRLIESPRRCVFFGTTNRETYLTDETGNRRFKPVVVGSLDFASLRRDRLQLFSEAKHLWLTKQETEMTMELTADAKTFEREIHTQKMVLDDTFAMTELMRDFVEKVEAEKIEFDLSKFRIVELFEGCGPLTKWKPETRNMVFAAKMLRRMGAEDRYIKGRKHWRVGDEHQKVALKHTPQKPNDHQELSFI